MKKPLRIAYIDHTGEMGGAEHLLLNLFRELPLNDIEPFLFCGQDGRFAKEAESIGVTVKVVELSRLFSTSWVFGNRKFLNPVAILWNIFILLLSSLYLTQELRKYSLDIIQTNSFFSHVYGGLAARILRIPCIWYLHDLVETSRLRGTIAFIWKILAYTLSSHIVADSKAVLEHIAISSFGRVIYPGVKEPSESSNGKRISLHKRLDLPNEVVLVGTLGRITFVKGLDILIEAAQMIIPEYPKVHFVILGGALFGEENYKRDLEEKVILSNLSSNWHWMGYDEYAKEYLSELNFVVTPSRREAFGLAIVEANLSGKAVIASSVGGIPEIIINRETGLLVHPEAPQKLATAIIELVNNQLYAQEMGEKAKIRAKVLFNITRYRKEFLDFYETVI